MKRLIPVMLLLLMPLTAGAVGMGRLNVLSSLGQPLRAEVELLAVSKADVSTLIVRLAPAEAYRQANIPLVAAESGIRVSIAQRADGRPYISIISMRAVNEPFVNLIIELSWSSGILTREYAVLLDPPGYTPAQTAAVSAAPAAPPAEAAVTTPVPPRPAPVAAPAPPPAPAKQAPAQEYTVKRGDTLGGIARSVRPQGVSVEQMLVALYRSNPGAFINNNMNLLRAGATLRVPGQDELAGTTSADARKEVRLHTADWHRYRQRLADTAGSAGEGKRAPQAQKMKVEDKAAAAKTRPVLRLSSGEPGKDAASAERVRALEEELIARERELKEANRRIQDLEKASRPK